MLRMKRVLHIILVNIPVFASLQFQYGLGGMGTKCTCRKYEAKPKIKRTYASWDFLSEKLICTKTTTKTVRHNEKDVDPLGSRHFYVFKNSGYSSQICIIKTLFFLHIPCPVITVVHPGVHTICDRIGYATGIEITLLFDCQIVGLTD